MAKTSTNSNVDRTVALSIWTMILTASCACGNDSKRNDENQSQSSLDHVLSPFSKNKIMAYRGSEGRVARCYLSTRSQIPTTPLSVTSGFCRERTWAHRRPGVPPGGDSNERRIAKQSQSHSYEV